MGIHYPARTLAGAFILLLAACSTPGTKGPTISPDLTLEEKRAQKALHIQRVVAYQARLERISAPLLQAALPFCVEQQTVYIGARVDNLDAWPPDYYTIARDVLQLDHALKVTMVTPESPAQQAGLKVGDVILSVNGKAAIGGQGAVTDFRRLIAKAVDDKTASHGRIALEVFRNGASEQVSIAPLAMCDYPVHIVMDNAINAFATGKHIGVTSGLIRFAESDDEIAMVVAHEIAHNSRKHIEAKIQNAQVASVFDIIAAAYGVSTGGVFARMGAQSFSKDFEREADYFGLYILARAGRPLSGLEDFWRRIAAEDPLKNEDSMFRSHPVSAERTVAIRETQAEIAAKRAAGEPLVPEEKE